MKATRYYLQMRQRADRRWIRDEWVLQAIHDRRWEVVQQDGRIRRWTWIPDAGRFSLACEARSAK